MKATPITVEIIKLKESRLAAISEFNEHTVDQIDRNIAILIDLLPAEKEALIEAHVNGQAKIMKSPNVHRIADAKTWFFTTYTQDYKMK